MSFITKFDAIIRRTIALQRNALVLPCALLHVLLRFAAEAAQRILTTMVKVVVSAAMARAWSCSARGRESLTREGRSCYCVRQTQILILFAGSNIQTTVMIRLGKQDNVGYIAIYLFSFSHFGYITIFSSLIFFIILFLSSSVRSLIHPVYYTLFILPYIGSGASPVSPFYSASQHRARSTPYVRVYRTPHCSARVSLLGGVELGISQGQCPSPSMPSRVASAFIPTLMPGLGVTSEWLKSSLDFASLKGSCK